jgi:hypothetical protein
MTAGKCAPLRFHGRYAYISPTVEGYIGNVAMIWILRTRFRVGRWWIPGQWQAGGETYPWATAFAALHHPLRMGDRPYQLLASRSFILDIRHDAASDRASQFQPGISPSDAYLPAGAAAARRNIMVVADEDVAKLRPAAPAFT